MRRTAALASAIAGVALAGCGALPPQAPLPFAAKLDSATSGISTACGEAYRTTALEGDHNPALGQLEKTALTDVHKLVGVFRRNRKWVYQGFTVAEITSDGVAMLNSCGLHEAARQLRAATTST